MRAQVALVVLLCARLVGAQGLDPLPDLPLVGTEPVESPAEPVAPEPAAPEPVAPEPAAPEPAAPEVTAPAEVIAPEATPRSIAAPAVPATAEPSAACSEQGAREAYAAASWRHFALPEPPVFDPDTLAHGSSFRMIAGNLDVSGVTADNDLDDETLELGLNIDTRYYLGHEATTYGFSVEVEASDALSRTPMRAFPGDPSTSRTTNDLGLGLVPEARFYPLAGSPLFLHMSGELEVSVLTVLEDDESDSVIPGSVGAVVGVGVGRVLNIDPVVRLRRLERALATQELLHQGIGQETGTQIIGSWYALRNEIGTYPLLAATMKHLDAAGLLRSAPDLRSVYQAQQVLADPFIIDRRRGWDVRIGAGVVQSFRGSDELDEPDPTVAILASGQLEHPVDTENQFSLRGKLLIELGDTNETSRPWSARLFGAFTRVFYTDTFDPTGSLTAAVEAGVSGRREIFGEREAGVDMAGTLAYSRLLNRGSFATAGLALHARNDGLLTLTLNVGVTWGVATGFFTPYSSVVL